MSDPNDNEYWFKKAMKGIYKSGIVGTIFEDLRKSLELNPDHIDSWIYYAGFYTHSDNNDKIVEIVQKLLNYEPKIEQSPNLFEFVINETKNYNEDDSPLKKPYENRTMHYTLQYCGEWLITAVSHLRSNEVNKALEAFQKAFSFPRNRNQAIYYYFYLAIYALSKKYDKALEYGEKAVELDPKFKYAWYGLSRVYMDKEDYNYALDSINKALEIDDQFKPALKLKEEIKKIRSKTIEKNGGNYYQRQKFNKEEYEFLITLEKECGKPIPAVSVVKWDDAISNFGFVVREGHVMELGITYEAEKLNIIPESIKNLKHLEVLSIARANYLRRFPESIIYLENLKYLRYDHYPMPYIEDLNQELLPEVICSLKSLEVLNISESSITTLPECLVYFPNLKKINISMCHNLREIPPIFKEYFAYEEYQYPLRRYLIRKKYPIKSKEDKITPNTIYESYSQKLIDDEQATEILISIIENEKLLEKRIEAINVLKMLSCCNEAALKVLENLIKEDKSILIRMAAANAILKIFPNKAIQPIKLLILNDKSVEIIDFIRNIIKNSESSMIQSIKSELLDFFTLLDIEKLIGQRLPKIDDFTTIKKKYNRVQGPHGYIKKNNRITHLGLNTYSYCVNHELNSLPASIGDLSQLEEISLMDCWYLNRLPETIGNLKNLKRLDCTGCRQLKAIPDNLGKLQNLEYLNLSECYSLKKIPSSLGKLKNLHTLILKDCQSITNLPKGLSNLTLLKILDLENCRSLKSLPETIINLQNLEELNLHRCRRLDVIPENIGNMDFLKTLKLKSCTRLKEIPENISNLQLLNILDLSYCYHLIKLPEGIANWKSLTKIICRGCRELQNLPESIGNLQNLQDIDLYACRNLKFLPNSICNLKNLKKLDLSYCESLDSLPDSIFNLKNLEEMNLDGCTSLTSIPESIGLLTNLDVYKIHDKRDYSYLSESDVKYQLESPPPYSNNQYWPSNIKNHQEKMHFKFKFPNTLLNEKVQRIIQKGVNPRDAENLSKFFMIIDMELRKAPLFEDLDENQDDMHAMFAFKVNNEGHVLELHIHHTESISVSLFPEPLCHLSELEVVRFPNNIIEYIPECITNLKSLRVLDISNFEAPTATIPTSAKSFIESLESYNDFYKYY